VPFLLVGASALCWLGVAPAGKGSSNVLRGPAAFTDYRKEQPGVFRRITPPDLPMPYETKSALNYPKLVPRPTSAWPQAPAGFKVDLYVSGLDQPRLIRTAPNGDLFVAESHAGEIEVFRGVAANGKPEQMSVFASGLRQPFGIAFYPPGGNPRWVYVANTDSVIRLPYRTGDLKAGGPATVVVTHLPTGGGHWTRDVAFSRDGKRMFVSIGSSSNVADPRTRPADRYRANILEYNPEGTLVKVYASGIRNPVGLAVNPLTGELWCSTNERDGLGDNLVPDYITHVQEDGFYGWPWYYIGAHEDPRREGERPGLKNTVLVPDVLVQAHSASLEMVFYGGTQFPAEYSGDIFAAEHGSWNKAVRAGYEVVRVPLEKGRASGEYEDFLTGFLTADGDVWGRPVGVAVAQDGSLMVTDDGSKSIWRVSYVRTAARDGRKLGNLPQGERGYAR
jgi:glucose/arabinose dehydrogenase